MLPSSEGARYSHIGTWIKVSINNMPILSVDMSPRNIKIHSLIRARSKIVVGTVIYEMSEIIATVSGIGNVDKNSNDNKY